ncbi:helix-turn-helix domain-containing protein [Thermomonospora amylolytica]|uniref:helix-turn-helix domain-containing protein n=1 Tax=Thermomonospora amylolytica TaxID=1411117 RepID=UPI000E6B58F5|nr:helix-turn-helix transcriptional regulator [Thermomonospora amylolytica]
MGHDAALDRDRQISEPVPASAGADEVRQALDQVGRLRTRPAEQSRWGGAGEAAPQIATAAPVALGGPGLSDPACPPGAPRPNATSDRPPVERRAIPAGLRDAMRAVRLADQGVAREEVIRLARNVLAAPAWRDAGAFWHAVVALAYADELDEAHEQCERAFRTAGWTTTSWHRDALTLLRARVAWLRGDPGTAADLLADAAERGLLPQFSGLATAWRVAALVDLGELDRGHGLLMECDVDGRQADAGERVELLAARGGLHFAAGRVELAGDDFRACGRILLERGVVNPAVVPWRSRAALCAHLLGHRTVAGALARQELIAANRWGGARSVGVAMHAAALALSSGAEALREAEAVLERSRAIGDLLRVRYDLAWSLNAQKEHRSARRVLERTRDLARRAGYRLWAERAEAALARMARPDGVDRLTPQERRIAELARAGLSNGQIAQELSLTKRTVEFHLTGVYRKLGIRGRRDLRTILIPLC